MRCNKDILKENDCVSDVYHSKYYVGNFSKGRIYDNLELAIKAIIQQLEYTNNIYVERIEE